MAIAANEDAIIAARLAELGKAVEVLRSLHAEIARAISLLRECAQARRLVLTCGNGGSAAEAMHLAEELVGRYRTSRAPIGAVCLNADPTALTCIANDFGFEEVFARQVTALARPGDLLVAFSTSGRSPNVVRALEEARRAGARTLGLLGGAGAPAAELCECALVVRGVDSAAVQEAHQAIMHMLCEALEPR
jgi:D-sedoheptulose 7-phosphate isomerase